MKGYVGICAQEGARYTKFWADLQNLEAPDGVEVRINYDGTLGQARNAHVEQFLRTDAGWMVMIDDDHAISPEFLRRWLKTHETLLNRPVNLPIVASLYLQRGAPFAPTLYGPPEKGIDSDQVTLPLLSLREFPTSGIVYVYAAGASGMFVRRDVYEKMSPPWYELGQSDNVGEDFWFCVKARRLGFDTCVDLDSRLGHLAPFEVWPDVVDGQWVTSIRRGKVGMLIDPADTGSLTATAPEGALV